MISAPHQIPDHIALSVTLSATPAAIWHALTLGREAWWSQMHFEPWVGAPLEESWQLEDGSRYLATGTITLAEPCRRLGFAWTDPGCESALHVELVLEPAAHGTLLFLEETGFAALSRGAELHREHTQGWLGHLGNLEWAAAAASPV